MEGPSLVILRHELKGFIGKKVIKCSGNAKIDHERIANKKILDIKSWGKLLLIQFDGFALRIHFLMFGSYRINERKDQVPRMRFEFAKGKELNFYTCAIRELTDNLDQSFDWESDVMSDAWNPAKARRKLKKQPATNVGDALLDQTIFGGVGNIIKSEVLFRIFVHPESTIGALPPRKLTALISEARNYSFNFLEWKKIYQLRKHWLIYTKKKCPRCNIPSRKEYTGLTKRRTFFCDNCQVLYDL